MGETNYEKKMGKGDWEKESEKLEKCERFGNREKEKERLERKKGRDKGIGKQRLRERERGIDRERHWERERD